MEIKLSAGDKINIPENCKATIEDNLIIIEEKQEEKQEMFKDGDILHAKDVDIIAIFKSYEHNRAKTFCSYYNSEGLSNTNWGSFCFEHATEEEKQAFFDELEAKGLRWNAEAKTMEKIRKRAKLNEHYLYIGRNGEVLEVMDYKIPYDDNNYDVGNYYLPEEREQAEEDAKAIKAIFEKRLKI